MGAASSQQAQASGAARGLLFTASPPTGRSSRWRSESTTERRHSSPQPEVVGTTRLFVVPNPSPANAHFTLADQATWYDRLAEFLDATASAKPER